MADQHGVDFFKPEQERLSRLLAVVGYPMRDRIEADLKQVNALLDELQQSSGQ